jgi:hypothetical protein
MGGVSLLGLSLPGLQFSFPPADPFTDQQGRVLSRLLWAYDQPSFHGNHVKMYWRDLVIPIAGTAISDDAQAYNRVWYQVGENDGYVYSGDVQPVHTLLNTPVTAVPSTGALAEVSVPFTDALEQADPQSAFGYRLYYGTVHWVTAVETDAQGKMWYQVLDDKWNKHYYAPAEHLRILAGEELAPLSRDVPDDQKQIEVHLADQLLFARENGQTVFATRIASGAVLQSGTYTTPTGTFTTYHKRPTRHMAAGDITANGFDLPGVPWVMYMTESGISLHGTYWHNDFGHPRSHGCVNLSLAAAKWLFRWTKPIVRPQDQFTYDVFHRGTQVTIIA